MEVVHKGVIVQSLHRRMHIFPMDIIMSMAKYSVLKVKYFQLQVSLNRESLSIVTIFQLKLYNCYFSSKHMLSVKYSL